jgi:hypothetical protein
MRQTCWRRQVKVLNTLSARAISFLQVAGRTRHILLHLIRIQHYYFFARSREDTNFRAGMTSSLPVTTQWAGDINQDNVINMVDVMEIAKVFNTNSTSEKFNPACDLNRDNSINMVDIMILAAHFNQ